MRENLGLVAIPLLRGDLILPLSTPCFRATRMGLVIEGHPTYEQWSDYGSMLQAAEGAIHWIIGDWLNYGERVYGETYTQAVEETGYSQGTLANDKWTCGAVDPWRRCEGLSFAHHAEVASLPPSEQTAWLGQAQDGGWTRHELRARLRAQRAVADLPPVAGNSIQVVEGRIQDVYQGLGLFDLIVADPYPERSSLESGLYMDRLAEWLLVIQRCLQRQHHLFWFCWPELATDTEIALRDAGMEVKSWIVWSRKFASDQAREVEDSGRFARTWKMIYHVGCGPLHFHSGLQPQVDVWAYPMYGPGPRPIGLVQQIVNIGSWPSQRVLDPFAGAGEVGAACAGSRLCVLVEESAVKAALLRQRFGT